MIIRKKILDEANRKELALYENNNSNIRALKRVIREAILLEYSIENIPSKDELDKMEAGKKIILIVPGQPDFTMFQKAGPNLFKCTGDFELSDWWDTLSPAAKANPKYEQSKMKELEGILIVPIADINQSNTKYFATDNIKLIGFGNGQFREITQHNTDQMLKAMNAYIADYPDWIFRII